MNTIPIDPFGSMVVAAAVSTTIAMVTNSRFTIEIVVLLVPINFPNEEMPFDVPKDMKRIKLRVAYFLFCFSNHSSQIESTLHISS